MKSTKGHKEKKIDDQDQPKSKNKYIRFGIVTLIYLLWVIWVGNWWLLLGIPILYDIYVSKKVNWTFWKKRNGPNSKVVEWIDALIFAVVAVTLINIFIFQNYKIPTGSMEKTLLIGDHLYVSKIRFGPKIPNTPLSFPFAQHTLPFTQKTKSYLEWIKWPYHRLAGITKIKNDDNVVFNFPEGDTVLIADQASSYYARVRQEAEHLQMLDQSVGLKNPFSFYEYQARKSILSREEITVRPVDKKDNYIKRCVAIPGDTLRIVNGQVFINGKPQELIEKLQYRYALQTDGSPINSKTLEKMDVYQSDFQPLYELGSGWFTILLTDANFELVKKMSNVRVVEKMIRPMGMYDSNIFPHSELYPWNVDNFGPLWIPKKDVTVKIDTSNICFYARVISAYEGNELRISDGVIYINGAPADSYTFKMDYYWMMGDNRHDSLDSRFWGFVPEDHIVGAPRIVWLSLNKEKSFPMSIRWNRIFTSAAR